MKAQLIKQNDNFSVIEWGEGGEQFGQLTFQFVDGNWILDSELLGIESIIEIIKSIE